MELETKKGQMYNNEKWGSYTPFIATPFYGNLMQKNEMGPRPHWRSAVFATERREMHICAYNG